MTVRLNRDFVEARLTAPDILALVESWQRGAISRRTLHDNLRAGEVLPPGRDFAEEQRLIETEQP